MKQVYSKGAGYWRGNEEPSGFSNGPRLPQAVINVKVKAMNNNL